MAQMIYANPFGAAAEGAQRGLDNVLKLGQAGRAFRDSDRQAEFRKWYDPFVQKQMQQKYDADAEAARIEHLKNLANAGRYVGDLGIFNQGIGDFYGQTPQGTRTPTQAQTAADIFSGAIPPAFAYPDVNAAGGISRKTPLTPAEQELQALTNQLTRAQANYYTNLYQNPSQQYHYGAQTPMLGGDDIFGQTFGVGGVQTFPQPQSVMPGVMPQQNQGGGFDPYTKPQEPQPQEDIFDQRYLNDPYGEF